MEQYVITYYKKKYYMYDILSMEFNPCSNADVIVRIDKNNKMFATYSYKVLDDWYADIGPIYNEEKEKQYLGTVIFRTDSLYELMNRYKELTE